LSDGSGSCEDFVGNGKSCEQEVMYDFKIKNYASLCTTVKTLNVNIDGMEKSIDLGSVKNQKFCKDASFPVSLKTKVDLCKLENIVKFKMNGGRLKKGCDFPTPNTKDDDET